MRQKRSGKAENPTERQDPPEKDSFDRAKKAIPYSGMASPPPSDRFLPGSRGKIVTGGNFRISPRTGKARI